MIHELLRAFLHYTGSSNPSGPWYGFFSGFGSDFGEVSLIAGGYFLIRKHNCHEHGCWRVQFKPHPEDRDHLVCRKHHRKAIGAQVSNTASRASMRVQH